MRRKLDVDIPALLEELGVESNRSGDELRGHCPDPNHQKRPGPGSWQIKLYDDRAGQHHCYACGYGGGLVTLVKTVLEFEGKDAGKKAWKWLREFSGHHLPGGVMPAIWRRKLEKRDRGGRLRLPPETGALWGPDFGPTTEIWKAAEYLRGRGVLDEEIERYRMGAVPASARAYAGRIIVPVVVGGILVDYVARLFVPKPETIPKALSGRRDRGARKEFALWGYDFLDPLVRTVYVVEGVWGALALLRAGLLNVIAACGSAWTPERTELLEPWERIVLIPDGDPAGRKFERRTSSLRFGHEVRVVDLPLGTQPDYFEPSEALERVAVTRPARFSKLAAHLTG